MADSNFLKKTGTRHHGKHHDTTVTRTRTGDGSSTHTHTHTHTKTTDKGTTRKGRQTKGR